MDSITPESVEILDQIDDGSTKSEIYEPEGGQRAQAEQSDLDGKFKRSMSLKSVLF